MFKEDVKSWEYRACPARSYRYVANGRTDFDESGGIFEQSDELRRYLPSSPVSNFPMSSTYHQQKKELELKPLGDSWHQHFVAIAKVLRFKTRKIDDNPNGYNWCLVDINASAASGLAIEQKFVLVRWRTFVLGDIKVGGEDRVLLEGQLEFKKKGHAATNGTNGIFMARWRWIPKKN